MINIYCSYNKLFLILFKAQLYKKMPALLAGMSLTDSHLNIWVEFYAGGNKLSPHLIPFQHENNLKLCLRFQRDHRLGGKE